MLTDRQIDDILHAGVGLEHFLAAHLHRTTPASNVSATHLVSRAGFAMLCSIASMGYEHARTFVTRGLWDVLALRRTMAVPVSSLLAVCVAFPPALWLRNEGHRLLAQLRIELNLEKL